MTASSFNMLSLDPPLILWSLSLRAPSLQVYRAASRFAVNIPGADQTAVALPFARPSEDKFRDQALQDGIGGVPLLSAAIADLECEAMRRDDGGDHELFIGRVVRASYGDRASLIFAKGSFDQFASLG